ncbi:integrase [Tardiphaga sp. 866_E4_N2_1]|uniref:integrase n=1 Tax=unclassified Tardiphaga TaxID=2631404 RepID=UPI003F255230
MAIDYQPSKPSGAARAPQIDTPAKRGKLQPRKNPYWIGVSGGRGGVSLGYRKGKGVSVWVVKAVIDGDRIEARLGSVADGDEIAGETLNYTAAVSAALAWGRQQASIIEASREADRVAAVPTVRSVVEAYEVQRRKAAGGRSTSASALLAHLPPDSKFAKLRLAQVSEKAIEEWVGQLKRQPQSKPSRLTKRPRRSKSAPVANLPPLKPASRNRLVGDLRAALNVGAERHRREIPGHVQAEIKAGTRNEPTEDEARKQLLTDGQVRAIVAGAFEDDEDFGYVVFVLAVTGARFSQIARLTVADVQISKNRIMVPSSRKGRKRKPSPPAAVPIDANAMARLTPLVAGRDTGEPLLLRWAHKRVPGPKRWARDVRRPWGPAFETSKSWQKAVQASGLPADTIMYALRHSSIVRGLIGGLPVRLVAALHDTSVLMIEKHYSAFIIDMTEELSRRHAISIDTQLPHQAAE